MEVVSPEVTIDTHEYREYLVEKMETDDVSEADVLATARKNIGAWFGYFNDNLTRAREDVSFLIQDQWAESERAQYQRLFRPSLTFNKLLNVVRKVVAEQRNNQGDLIVRSMTGKATQEEINLRSDLIRSICYNSQAHLVYQNAFDSSLKRGFGCWDVVIDWESPRSFNKIIRLELQRDPNHVAFDPSAMLPHKGDGNFCSTLTRYTKDAFYAEFPWVMNAVSYVDPRTQSTIDWENRDSIIVCKYTQKEYYNVRLFLLDNGMIVTESEWEEMQEKFQAIKFASEKSVVVKDMILETIPKIRAERLSQDYKIRQYKLIHNEILEYVDWPSKHLNLIFVDGDSTYHDGTQRTKSLIHDAKDAQRFINYVGSEIAAEIKNRRREQWVATPDNIEGYDEYWRTPELQNGALIAKPDPITQQMPIKVAPSEVPQTLLMQFQRGSQDIREIIGISETEQLQGRDISGKARRERRMEGAAAAFVFFDNLAQATEQSGRVVLDLLPTVYGEYERTVNVKKPDGRTETLVLNKQQGEEIKNKITEGDYDIEIDTGASFAVQKEVALEFFQQTIAANPQTFNLIADLWAKNLDVQYMPQIADRFKTLVPPQIIAQEEGKPAPQPQPSPQEMMMQQQLQMQQAEMAEKAKKIQLAEEELQIKKAKLDLEQQDLMLKAQTQMSKSATEQQYNQLEAGKAQLDYAVAQEKLRHDFAKHMHTLAHNDKRQY